MRRKICVLDASRQSVDRIRHDIHKQNRKNAKPNHRGRDYIQPLRFEEATGNGFCDLSMLCTYGRMEANSASLQFIAELLAPLLNFGEHFTFELLRLGDQDV